MRTNEVACHQSCRADSRLPYDFHGTFSGNPAFDTTFSEDRRLEVAMPRANRVYTDNSVYEIVPRTREHLPMPPTETTNEIRLGILGRTQRDLKVELCHFVDMNSHSHTIGVSTTIEKLNKFHMELKKKTTDAVKALLRIPSLSLWEDRTGVFKIASLQDAIERIAYLYCNPSNASLCDSIEQYAGINSWKAFKECVPSIDAEVTINARWYPVSEIPALPAGRTLSPKQDAALCQELRSSEEAMEHPIVLKPFKWLEPFGITDPLEIEAIRQKIIARVYETEQANVEVRAKANKRAVPRAALTQQQFMKPHKPKKKDRKIFVICSDKELRLSLLASFKRTISRCRECYNLAKAGIRVDWPPGTFIPWFPPGFVFPLPAVA